MNDKISYIENVLHFVFEGEFSKTVKQFPSPESEIESWYKIASVYDQVSSCGHISDDENNSLFDLVEDDCTDIVASMLLNEEPEIDVPLGDGYDLPEEFVKKWQPIIWNAVIQIYKSE